MLAAAAAAAAAEPRAGRDPYDRELADLIAQHSNRRDDFRRWAGHHIRIHTSCVKLLHYLVVESDCPAPVPGSATVMRRGFRYADLRVDGARIRCCRRTVKMQ
jgi:hypothetical protein